MKCQQPDCEKEATYDATLIVVEDFASLNATRKVQTKLCGEHDQELREAYGFDYI